MADFKKVKNILHLVVWILAMAAGGCIANIGCFGCKWDNWCENQFIDGVIYGFIIIGFLLFAVILFDEEVPEKTGYLLTIAGALLNIGAGVFLVLHRKHSTDDTRALVGGILAGINGAIFLFEFIASLTKKELLN